VPLLPRRLCLLCPATALPRHIMHPCGGAGSEQRMVLASYTASDMYIQYLYRRMWRRVQQHRMSCTAPQDAAPPAASSAAVRPYQCVCVCARTCVHACVRVEARVVQRGWFSVRLAGA
jgi:hypothetical protein